MSKQLTFTYNGQEYILEYTRRTVEAMERNGFVASDLKDKPMLTLPALFEGAFKAHHPWAKKEVIREIYDKLTDKQELIGKLAEMYNEPINALVEDPDDDQGNVKWTASW